jgi:hypothetical protein
MAGVVHEIKADGSVGDVVHSFLVAAGRFGLGVSEDGRVQFFELPSEPVASGGARQGFDANNMFVIKG